MWEFLSKNKLEDLLEKLIDKKMTRKKQVDELEGLWKFLSKNKLGDLLEKLIDRGYTTVESLSLIDKQRVDKLGLKIGEVDQLVSVLEVIFTYS